jgi:gliding motility-associated-like protein
VKVPTAFSPNSDGNNDILYARGIKVTNLQFQIFNRWGQIVFESKDVNNGWDGNFNGQPLNSEVFVYFVKATCPDRTTIERKGTVTLIR